LLAVCFFVYSARSSTLLFSETSVWDNTAPHSFRSFGLLLFQSVSMNETSLLFWSSCGVDREGGVPCHISYISSRIYICKMLKQKLRNSNVASRWLSAGRGGVHANKPAPLAHWKTVRPFSSSHIFQESRTPCPSSMHETFLGM
jgi:hypothetical protein